MLNGVGLVTGSVMGPLVNSKQGRAFLSMMPGEVLLASFDAVGMFYFSRACYFGKIYENVMYMVLANSKILMHR